MKNQIQKFVRSIRGPRSVDSILKTFNRSLTSLQQAAADHRAKAEGHVKAAEAQVALAKTSRDEANRAERTAEKFSAFLA